MSQRTRKVFQGRVISLTVDSVDLPNGTHAELEIVHHPGGAAVVAVDEAQRVCMLRQYRHAAGGWIWELPAGKLEPGEAPQLTAARELQEEAGIAAANWQSLGQYLSSPGVFTERVHLFLATGLRPVTARPEAGEVFELHWIPFSTAVEKVHESEYFDGKTALGLLKAQRLLGAGKM